MSTASPVINQNIEIITVICTGKGSALTEAFLLQQLQQKYPETGWNPVLLATRLRNGVKTGLYLAVGANPGSSVVEGYSLQPNMLNLNPLNMVYEPFCSQIIPLVCTPASCQVGKGYSGSK